MANDIHVIWQTGGVQLRSVGLEAWVSGHNWSIYDGLTGEKYLTGNCENEEHGIETCRIFMAAYTPQTNNLA